MTRQDDPATSSYLIGRVAKAIMDTQDMGNVDAQASAAIKAVLQDQIEWSVGYDWRQAIARYAQDNGIEL